VRVYVCVCAVCVYVYKCACVDVCANTDSECILLMAAWAVDRDDYEQFLRDLEEDRELRASINLFKGTRCPHTQTTRACLHVHAHTCKY
jgi:hypothetical protein